MESDPMVNDIQRTLTSIIEAVASMQEVRAVGQTGEPGKLPSLGESDIDIFVICEASPSREIRRSLYGRFSDQNWIDRCQISVCEGGDWGVGDAFQVQGVDTMLMYFTANEMEEYLDAVLAGRHLDCINGFYPVGRCATMQNIQILYERDGYLTHLKEKLATYPLELARQMVGHHLPLAHDLEDFGRAVRRQDVLFYHQVLENGLDHYLLALFSLNRIYFPSRKRTRQMIEKFEIKPQDCTERLLQVVRLGAVPEGIPASYAIWRGLVEDLEGLAESC